MTGGWPKGIRWTRTPLAIRLGRVGRGTEWSPGRRFGEGFGGPNTDAGRYGDRPSHPPVGGQIVLVIHGSRVTFFACNMVNLHTILCTDI
jgi:hypothetical protein